MKKINFLAMISLGAVLFLSPRWSAAETNSPASATASATSAAAKEPKLIEEKKAYEFRSLPDAKALDNLKKTLEGYKKQMDSLKSDRDDLMARAEKLKKEKDFLGQTEYKAQLSQLADKARSLGEKFEPIKKRADPMQLEVEYEQLLLDNKGYGPSWEDFKAARAKKAAKPAPKTEATDPAKKP